MKSKFIFLAPLMFIPHLILLLKSSICGWDCPWYLYQLRWGDFGVLLSSVEPLYMVLFKPLSYILTEPLVVKISLVATIIVSAYGMYILSQRIGFTRKESIVVTALFVTGIGTMVMWYSTLRNFLMFSMLPYFLYFYLSGKKNDYLISVGIMLLMALAHRTVLLIFPVMGIYRIMNKDYKGLTYDVALGMVVFLMFILMGSDPATGSGNLISAQFAFFNKYGLFSGMLDNIWKIIYWNRTLLLAALAGMLFIDKSNKKHMFFLIMIIVMVAVTIPFSHMVGDRAAYFIALPAAVFGGLLFRKMHAFNNIWKIGAAVIFISIAVGAISHSVYTYTFVSEDEMEFIQSLDIPENSTIVLPGRLEYYSKYVWNDYYDLRPIPYEAYAREYKSDERLLAAYDGRNMFDDDIYYIDVNHKKPEDAPRLVYLPR